MLNYKVIVVTNFAENAIVFWHSKTSEAVVVDPGGDIEKILDFIYERKLNLKQIWITHGHIDHVGGVIELKKATGAFVYGPSEEDQFWLDNLPNQADFFGFRSVSKFKPDQYAKDGDIVKLGEFEFEVMHTPGHTPGHIVFYQKDLNLVCAGDLIFAGSVGRTDFPQGSQEDLINSITKKLWKLGDAEIISGHGPKSSIGRERRVNPFVADSVLSEK